jgi:hypothetical protein
MRSSIVLSLSIDHSLSRSLSWWVLRLGGRLLEVSARFGTLKLTLHLSTSDAIWNSSSAERSRFLRKNSLWMTFLSARRCKLRPDSVSTFCRYFLFLFPVRPLYRYGQTPRMESDALFFLTRQKPLLAVVCPSLPCHIVAEVLLADIFESDLNAGSW